MTESYLAPISSNTSHAVGAAPLSGIAGETLSGLEGVDEVASRFVAGIFHRLAPGILATFAAASLDCTPTLAPGARALPVGAARFPPCMSTLP